MTLTEIQDRHGLTSGPEVTTNAATFAPEIVAYVVRSRGERARGNLEDMYGE